MKATLSNASVYVGTYRKYNNGSLSGAWLNLSDYESREELYAACRKLHKDEADPEFMFQDWEYIPNGFISEYGISNVLFAVIEASKQICNEEAFATWLDYYTEDDFADKDADDIEEMFNESYEGEYESDVDFAYHIVEEYYNLEGPLATYFDYQAFARDLFMSEYWSDNGYVFRCA